MTSQSDGDKAPLPTALTVPFPTPLPVTLPGSQSGVEVERKSQGHLTGHWANARLHSGGSPSRKRVPEEEISTALPPRRDFSILPRQTCLSESPESGCGKP